MKGSKVDMLPGLATTPAVFIAKLMETADEIENMGAVVHYKNGHTEAFWTKQSLGDLCWLRHVFNDEMPK